MMLLLSDFGKASVHGHASKGHQRQCTGLCDPLVDELHDLLQVPHEAVDTAHQVLDECSGHSCLGLSQLALLLQVSQQKPNELNDSHYKAANGNRPQMIPVNNKRY